jgi:sterol desaturase/sphingolipid hydroxylase (fatty acid hydroxylase superfamily)
MPFETLLIGNEPAIRLGIFVSAFVLVALWELFAPRRVLEIPRRVRWVNNLGLAAVNIFVVRVLFPSAVVSMAILANERGAGLLNAFPVPYPLAMILSLLALDLMMYLMHLMFHAVPALWRVHRVHHADVDFDVTTGVRFHPIQVVLMIPLKFAVVFVLGPPVLAVLVFEAMFNVFLAFSHSNIRIPAAVDRVLRWFVVTPDVHRLHHSVDATETNSNFGLAFTWWDRLFGTYRAEPAAGREGMTIGVDQFRARRDSWLDRLLLQPFRDDFGFYAINRRWEIGGSSTSDISVPER